MKAITVRHLPPTDTKPRRVKAQAEGVPARIFDSNSTTPRQAAEHLCAEYGWGVDLIEGNLPNGDAVFVFNPHSRLIRTGDKLANAAFALGAKAGKREALEEQLRLARAEWDTCK